MALTHDDLTQLLEMVRAGGDVDVVRESVEMVLQALIEAEATEVIGASPEGGPLRYSNWRRRVWLPACARAGLERFTFHDLRRAAATALVLEHVDMKTAQTLLGHSDPRLTLGLYAQSSSSAGRDAADRIGARFLSLPRPPRAHDTNRDV